MTHHELVEREGESVETDDIQVRQETCSAEVSILKLIDSSIIDSDFSEEDWVNLQRNDKHVSVLYKLSKSIEKEGTELLISYGISPSQFYLGGRGILWYKECTKRGDGRITEPRLVVP